MSTPWETVIGLEVHAQLKTLSKIFCTCSTGYGAEPNSQTCPVCLGLPGALPVLNMEVVRMTVLTGLALNCRIRSFNRMARKNYFYPDLSKGYQISQFEEPICEEGFLSVEVGDSVRRIGITRIHMEEDAGKSLHGYGDGTAVDFNRCGMGLMEIVSEPDLRSSQEARAYLVQLKQILETLEVSDCNMEEGSLRVDANLSIRPAGNADLGVKTEIKNLNSFRSVEHALHWEEKRQRELLDRGEQVVQETRLWNDRQGCTQTMRTKEEAHDYRYFPEPDLLPLSVSADLVEACRLQLPELPLTRQRRLMAEYGLGREAAGVLSARWQLAEYFEAMVRVGADPGTAAAWIQSELLHLLKVENRELSDLNLSPARLAEWLHAIDVGKMSQAAAKELFPELVRHPEQEVDEIIHGSGLEQDSDRASLQDLVNAIIEEHPEEWSRFQAGEEKLTGFFMGQVMRASGGRANPGIVRKVLMELK